MTAVGVVIILCARHAAFYFFRGFTSYPPHQRSALIYLKILRMSVQYLPNRQPIARTVQPDRLLVNTDQPRFGSNTQCGDWATTYCFAVAVLRLASAATPHRYSRPVLLCGPTQHLATSIHLKHLENQGAHNPLYVVGTAQSVNCFNKCGRVLRIDVLVNPVAKIKDMATPPAVTLQNGGNLFPDTLG